MIRPHSALLRWAAPASFAFAAFGCYATTIRSGARPVAAGIEYDAKWHHGLVWGIAELSGPYNLAHVCPQGWASIRTETSFLNGLTSAVTSGLYSPQTITVQCSVPERSPVRAPLEAPPHRELEPPPASHVLSSSH